MYTVGDLLKHLKQTTIYSIAPEDNISEAIAYMKEKEIGAASVKSGDELAGILTERDVLWKCDLKDDLSQVKVADIMTPAVEIISVSPGVGFNFYIYAGDPAYYINRDTFEIGFSVIAGGRISLTRFVAIRLDAMYWGRYIGPNLAVGLQLDLW